MLQNFRSNLTFLLGWPLSLIALIFLAKSFLPQLPTISRNFDHINWIFTVLALLCFILYYYTRSLVFVFILRYKNHHLDTNESLYQWSISQLKRYIPGNIWGIIGISVHFAKKNVSKKDIASAILLESELVVLAAVILSLLGLPIAAHLIPLPTALQLFIIVGSVAGTLVFLFSKRVKKIIPLPQHFLEYLFPSFSFEQMLNLFVLMTFAFFIYGLGTYFVVAAITYISPAVVWQYSGFFVLSLLLGFLSFITPTGLGVREGIMAFGLRLVITSSLASFIAILARGFLIVAEIISLLLMFAFHKFHNKFTRGVSSLFANKSHLTLLVVFYLIFVGYFATISILRYQNFYTGRFDLGNMDQTVWNTLHGHIFQLTDPNGTAIVSRLAFHADFILVLLAPFYFFWQNPQMLLILQTVITAAGVFFVYFLSRDILKNKTLALVFSVVFLLNPSLQRSVIYDFHAVTLATTFLLGAFYFMYKKKYTWFIVFALLAGITKEQIWAIIALFGLYIAFFQKRRVLGLAVFVISTVIAYLLIWKFIPQAAGAQHFALSYYSNGDITDSPTSLLKSFLFSPGKTFALLDSPARISYLNKLFAPVGYLSIFSPLLLIFAGPDLAINMLSSKAELYQIYYQYTAAITPFILISSIFGAGFLLKKIRQVSPFILSVYLVVVSLYTAYLYGPLPGAKEPNLDMITKVNPDKNAINRLLSAIPQKYSVAASNSLGAHLTHRTYLFTIPAGLDNADYIVFFANETNAYPLLDAHKQRIEDLKKDPRYVKYFDDGTILAFRKKSIPATPLN